MSSPVSLFVDDKLAQHGTRTSLWYWKLITMIKWWKGRQTSTENALFCIIKPYAFHFFYPFCTFITFFLFHPFQNGSEIYQSCSVLRYFNVCVTHIASSTETCLVVAAFMN